MEYQDMYGIHPDTCTHHIYIKQGSHAIWQPQWRLNPTLHDVVKEELQKLLNVGFIYPISDSRWVSPLVVLPKKNGKWHIFVDYWALNKATMKDRFQLPFVDQILDTLIRKWFFSFLDGFSGTIRFELSQKIRKNYLS